MEHFPSQLYQWWGNLWETLYESLIITIQPKKLRILVQFFGYSQFRTTSIFDGSTKIPLLEITCPRNPTSESQKSHLLYFEKSLFFLNYSKTILKCSWCCVSSLGYIRTSSIKTKTNLSRKGLKIRFIKSIKAAGPFVNPKASPQIHNIHI